ncbi:MAG: hypothetical protein IJ065_03630 [Eubacterium sp.]|nr:hypothetical protein [Eubacterium sp.]
MIQVALVEGLVWSVLWMIYIYILVKKYPWEMLHDYPEDIQKASTLPTPSTEQTKNARRFSVLFSLMIFGVMIAFGVVQYAGEKVSFGEMFLFTLIIAMVWNVVDLIVMDWLIICKLTAKWVIIEGTEGCKGYKDYMYHFKGFLIGCVYMIILALIISGIDYLILRFVVW